MRKAHKNRDEIYIEKLQLDDEEKEILNAFESGKVNIVKNVKKEILRAQEAAINSLQKDARINIRMSSVDLEHIKQKAAYEGMPYQTLISSILHKFAAGHLAVN